MDETPSGSFTSILNIIFIISGGVLTFVILFIFAKRQITRFALRSRRGPHVAIGTGAKKRLKKEIERRIEAVPRIVHEPRLQNNECSSSYILEPQQPYHYRFRAVDDVKTLEDEICRHEPGLRRHPRESLRAFLLSSLAAPLDGRGQKLVQQFCDAYESARHHPNQFGEDEYQAYHRLFLKLMDAARLLKSVSGVSRSSPQRRPDRPRPPAPPAHPAPPANMHYSTLTNLPTEPKLQEEVVCATTDLSGGELPTDRRDETSV